jgi:hypothetical protein
LAGVLRCFGQKSQNYSRNTTLFWFLVVSHICPTSIWHSKNNTFLSAMALPETQKVKILQEIQYFFDILGFPYLPDDHLAQQKQYIFVRRCAF